MPWDGSGDIEQLARTETFERAAPDGWSPDGSVLAFRYVPGESLDIWTLPAQGAAEPFLDTDFDETTPAFSPDGRWLAYESNQSGRGEVYLRSYPGHGRTVLISTDGGHSPVWAANGRELFYQEPARTETGTAAMMVVDIETHPELKAGKPKMLFRHSMNAASAANYDVTRDGKRFLMVRDDTTPPVDATELHIVLNWDQELLARVPVP